MNSAVYVLALALLGAEKAPAAAPDRPVDFRADVLPILATHCHSCHGATKQKGGLRLDDREAARRGGDSGPAYAPGKSSESELISRVSGLDPDTRMPPTGKPLSASQIATLRAWIEQGASWPDHLAVGKTKSSHWSFRPPNRPEAPASVNGMSAPIENPIDLFVRQRLAREGLKPSAMAPKETLLRRLSLDLTGLPPTPEEIAAFVKDAAPNAYERLVDRMLASPRFGERWARHWLDLARYADSDGYEKDLPRPHAWRYRQWVIDAINRDLPFDQFTVEQLAGDLLEAPTTDQLVATGFHRNTLRNLEGGVDQEEYRVKATVDRVHTTGTVWLGLTVGCAECHSHKYDPLTHREFYGLFAFFNNVDDKDISAPLPVERAQYERLRKVWDARHQPLAAALDQARVGLPARQAAWERELAKQPADSRSWKTLDATSFVSAGGASIEKLADRSLLVSGANPDKDQLTIVAPTTLDGITAIRLEGIPDERLPSKGPGRAPNGNFVLVELAVSVASANDPFVSDKVAFGEPFADVEQKGFPVKAAIDGKDGRKAVGWAIGQSGARHEAVFPFKVPVGRKGPKVLAVTLTEGYGGQHTIGRLRLSVTTAPPTELRNLIPEEIPALVAIPLEKRSPEQRKTVAEFYESIDREVAARRKVVDAHLKTQPSPPETKGQAFIERKEPRTTHIHIRGDFLRKGEVTPPHTPAFLHAFPTDKAPLNRLGLARWLFESDNPLTARVAVNRVWQRLFGRGLVATENDFGLQGEKPSHPELLDWLATEYPRLEWRTKRLVRLIVTSATYQQSSASSPELLEKDPKNVLLARQNRLRLEAEGVRDLFLAASGLIDERIGGPSVRPPLPAGIAELGYAGSVKWPESTGADRYRRGLYVFFQRTVPYPMLTTFDAPDSNTTCTRRERSNTPLQALTTLNDPVFIECAQALGRRLIDEAPAGGDERLRRATLLCLGREPDELELERLRRLDSQAREALARSAKDAEEIAGPPGRRKADAIDRAAAVVLARAMMNLDEFVVRE